MVTGAPIGAITARAYKEPTDAPEADGIFAWTDTTLVVTMVEGGDAIGLGYTDSAGSVTGLVTGKLARRGRRPGRVRPAALATGL